MPGIRYENGNEKSIHTDRIVKKYDYIINMKDSSQRSSNKETVTYLIAQGQNHVSSVFRNSNVVILVGGQIAIAILLLSLFDSTYHYNAFHSIGLFFFITLISAIYGLLIILICKKELKADLIASSCIAIFSLLSGTLIPIEQMPKVLQVLSFISPMRWVMDLFETTSYLTYHG